MTDYELRCNNWERFQKRQIGQLVRGMSKEERERAMERINAETLVRDVKDRSMLEMVKKLASK